MFALVLVLSLVTAVPAGAEATYLGTPPTIDGDLSEWEAAGTQYIYADGCLGGEQIGTGKLYIAFDNDSFYLAYKLEDAGPGDDYLYAFDGGFWFPDPSAYNSSAPLPSEFVLTSTTLELRQSWSGVRGAGAMYGEWYIEIVSNNAARIIRIGSMQATDGLVTNLDFYAGSYDGEDPFPGSYITDGVSKDLWVLTGFNALDPHFGQYSVSPPPPPVGGSIYPGNKLALLSPWIALGLVIIAGAIIFVRRRRAWS